MTIKFQIIDVKIESLSIGDKTPDIQSDLSALVKGYLTRTVQQATDKAYSDRVASRIREADCIVFRLEPTINWLEYSSQLDCLLFVFHNRSGRNSENEQLVIYTSDFTHKCECTLRHENSDQKLGDPDILNDIRQNELVEFLEKSRALYHHNSAAIFDLPSNQYSDFFLRVGNIQSNRGFIDAVFFWLIPELPQVGIIAVDTWSISTTAARIAQKATAYGVDIKAVEWDYLSSYLPNSPTSQELFKSIIFTAGTRKRELIFLCSLLSSGKVENAFYEIQRKSESPYPSKIVSIYTNAKELSSETNRLCQINQYLEKLSLKGKEIQLGTGDSTIYSIDPETYFPDYRKISPKPFRKGDAKDKTFFEKYAGKEVMSVHRNGRTSYHFSQEEHDTRGRHHAFHIDASRLFECAEFKETLWQKCSSFPYFNAIITDASTGSRRLYDIFSKNPNVNSNPVGLTEFPAFSKIDKDKEFVSLLKQDYEKKILILLPTIISGATLSDLQIKLRKINPVNTSFQFLIGLFRPPDQQKIDELLGEYLKPNKILAVEQLIIPNWQEDRCPWCLERDAIQEVLNSDELDDKEIHMLSGRLRILTDGAEEGLQTENVYFVEHPSNRLEFNSGSLFHDLSQIGIKNIELPPEIRTLT